MTTETTSFDWTQHTLFGHTSAETAHVTEDYPYGRLRCTRREWIETAEKGAQKDKQRVALQTQNPKTGKWNKPAYGTYWDIIVMFVNKKGHIDFSLIDMNSAPIHFIQFKFIADKLTPLQQQRLEGMEKIARTPVFNGDAWYDYDVAMGIVDPTVTPRPDNPWVIRRIQSSRVV